MRNMLSARKKLLFIILFSFESSIASESKLLVNSSLEFVGNFMKPNSAQKIKETCKQWSNLTIYEDIFPNESRVTVFRNVNTEEIIWETITFNETKFHAGENDSAKWSDAFMWSDNRRYAKHPMMLPAIIDDTDSILMLIKIGANVNQRSDVNGWTPLHFAAMYGSMNSCATLLDNDAKIDIDDQYGWTPLMRAAWDGKKNMFEFLIKKGANKNLRNNDGKNAFQIAQEEEEIRRRTDDFYEKNRFLNDDTEVYEEVLSNMPSLTTKSMDPLSTMPSLTIKSTNPLLTMPSNDPLSNMPSLTTKSNADPEKIPLYFEGFDYARPAFECCNKCGMSVDFRKGTIHSQHKVLIMPEWGYSALCNNCQNFLMISDWNTVQNVGNNIYFCEFIGVKYNAKNCLWEAQRYCTTQQKVIYGGGFTDKESAARESDSMAKDLTKNGQKSCWRCINVNKLNFPEE